MHKALIIVGPTAIGKSRLAEKYGKQFNLPIINADSRQLYKELTIGVAKPGEQELNSVNYYEINSCSIKEENNVALYCERVKTVLKDIKTDVIICGGTGLYIKSLIEGIDVLPPKNEELRNELKSIHEAQGIKGLQEVYNRIKNPYPLKDKQNPNRVMRAIEMGEQLPTSHIDAPLAGYAVTLLGLQSDRHQLYTKINQRVDMMMELGLEKEVQGLRDQQELEALKTVGYQELFMYFNGEWSREQAIDKIKQHTRNYAKRQITYFKNQLNVNWFNVAETEKIDTFVSSIL